MADEKQPSADVAAGKKRGRPKGVKDSAPRKRRVPKLTLALDNSAVTIALRADVALFFAAGLTDEQIAAALEIEIEVVRAHFAAESRSGDTLARAHNLRRLREAADAGSVNAMKAIQAILGAPPAAGEIGVARLGKKAQADAIARRAATSSTNPFAPPPAPAAVDKKKHDGESGDDWENLFGSRARPN